MKNDSPLFPFERPGDSMFDLNRDGELTGFETWMRDVNMFAEDDTDEGVAPADDFSSDFELGDWATEVDAGTAGKKHKQRIRYAEKLKDTLEVFVDRLEELANDAEMEADDLNMDSDRYDDLTQFSEAARDAADNMQNAVDALMQLFF